MIVFFGKPLRTKLKEIIQNNSQNQANIKVYLRHNYSISLKIQIHEKMTKKNTLTH